MHASSGRLIQYVSSVHAVAGWLIQYVSSARSVHRVARFICPMMQAVVQDPRVGRNNNLHMNLHVRNLAQEQQSDLMVITVGFRTIHTWCPHPSAFQRIPAHFSASKRFQAHPSASQRIPTHPNASQRIPVHPSSSLFARELPVGGRLGLHVGRTLGGRAAGRQREGTNGHLPAIQACFDPRRGSGRVL